MNSETLSNSISRLLCDETEVEQQGLDRFAIHTPFTFDDGDHYVSILKKEGDDWFVTDEGHTFMHMSYDDIDFQSTSRDRVIAESQAFHGIESIDGVLRCRVPQLEEAGHAVYSFVHALSKITNVTKFTREFKRSTFLEDFRLLMHEILVETPHQFDWHDPSRDPQNLYTVDCRIETKRPWHIFAIQSEGKCTDATITCLKMETFAPNSRAIAVFEDQTTLSPKKVAKLTDVVWKPFSSLAERERIGHYFQDEIFGTSA